jgi:hypothetical protein
MNRSVKSFAASGTALFSGTDDGVFMSTNGGAHWTDVSTGLLGPRIGCLLVNGADLLAGTTSGGVWRRPLAELVTSIQDTEIDAPRLFSLDQNYPNPFNPGTTIKYELPKSSMVRLSVYDMLGREVTVLVDEKREAGYHEVRFDGSGLASGVYLYRLQAGDFIHTRRLLLLR